MVKLVSEQIDRQGDVTWTYWTTALDEPLIVQLAPDWAEWNFHQLVRVRARANVTRDLDTGWQFVRGHQYWNLSPVLLDDDSEKVSRWREVCFHFTRQRFRDQLLWTAKERALYLQNPAIGLAIVEFKDPNGLIAIAGCYEFNRVFIAQDLEVSVPIERARL